MGKKHSQRFFSINSLHELENIAHMNNNKTISN